MISALLHHIVIMVEFNFRNKKRGWSLNIRLPLPIENIPNLSDTI